MIYFTSSFIAAGILTFFTRASPAFIWLAYLLWLSIVLGIFNFVNFVLIFFRRKKNYELKLVGQSPNLRVAAFITSYNEDPEIVKGTIRSVIAAVDGRGDVYLLDDSTDPDKKLYEFCRENNVRYIHRTKRRGYKAGAINDALKEIEDKYDLVAIFDADQRPTEDFFDVVLPQFKDERVGFVQIPQNYTELRTRISMGSKYQQEPFIKVIMEGRDRVSAFSLGSGTVFRISALKRAGYLYEKSITEDAATSVKIHELGYTSKYIDRQLIWYGEPPAYASSYFTQQSRWSLGTFQMLRELLSSNLSFGAFYDYISGWFYWMETGPLTLVQLLGPIMFLALRVPIIEINPILYLLFYFPYVLFSFSSYIAIMRRQEYGLKGFLYHQFIEYLEVMPVTASFFAWIMRRKVPFKVTPKGRIAGSARVLVFHLTFLALLCISIVLGINWVLSPAPIIIKEAVAVNVAWAIYHAFFMAGGAYIALNSREFEHNPYTHSVRAQTNVKSKLGILRKVKLL